MSAHSSQPYHTPKEEKDAYIEEVIEHLEFQPLADAIVISLNVEAEKRLTIGIELVSSSEHWLFLDEPASGLNGGSALIRDCNYCLGFLQMDIHRKNLMPQRRERGDHTMHCSTAPDQLHPLQTSRTRGTLHRTPSRYIVVGITNAC